MIYDDQPQMVEALFRFEGRRALEDAFAAIDREALIERAAQVLVEVIPDWGPKEEARVAEAVLVAAGIIPQRHSGHPPESTTEEYRA